MTVFFSDTVFLPFVQCDTVSVLEKKRGYREEHFDFIQSHIRRFCLQCILSRSEKFFRNLEARQECLNLALRMKLIGGIAH